MIQDIFEFQNNNQVPVVDPSSRDIQDIVLIPVQADQITNIIISPTPVLTWKSSGLKDQVKEIRFNKNLQAWMEENVSFRNWIYTVVSCHLSINPLDDITYPLPDQFRDEYGIECITVESFSHVALGIDIQTGRRPRPVLKECAIHIMV